jgi:hypothetical protein
MKIYITSIFILLIIGFINSNISFTFTLYPGNIPGNTKIELKLTARLQKYKASVNNPNCTVKRLLYDFTLQVHLTCSNQKIEYAISDESGPFFETLLKNQPYKSNKLNLGEFITIFKQWRATNENYVTNRIKILDEDTGNELLCASGGKFTVKQGIEPLGGEVILKHDTGAESVHIDGDIEVSKEKSVLQKLEDIENRLVIQDKRFITYQRKMKKMKKQFKLLISDVSKSNAVLEEKLNHIIDQLEKTKTF